MKENYILYKIKDNKKIAITPPIKFWALMKLLKIIYNTKKPNEKYKYERVI